MKAMRWKLFQRSTSRLCLPLVLKTVNIMYTRMMKLFVTTKSSRMFGNVLFEIIDMFLKQI